VPRAPAVPSGAATAMITVLAGPDALLLGSDEPVVPPEQTTKA
jgi:hypothetical protein